MLTVANLCKSFGALTVANDISMTLKKGERRVILGPNGAGKTTLFHLIAGTLKPSSGRIVMDGVDITRMPVHARAQAGLARSYQRNTLCHNLTIGENIALAAAQPLGLAKSLWRDTHKDVRLTASVGKIASQTGLADSLDVLVGNAPYGSKRQLEIAMALACRPKLLLMDEPTSGIGPDSIESFHRALKDLPRDLTVVIVEHDIDLAFDIADSITVLNCGEVIAEGKPEEIRKNPLVNEIYLGEWADA